MNYTSREVVRRLKQYDMFQNSLNLTNDEIQKERICDQLDKIEKQILLDTNTEYEEEYLMLLSKKAKFLDKETIIISFLWLYKSFITDKVLSFEPSSIKIICKFL